MYLERGRWRRDEYYYGKYNVNPMDYETEEDYLKALSLKVREDYDPFDEFPGLDPSTFDNPFEYDYEIDERREWKEEHDPADECDIDPGAYEYEDDYVEAIKKWKKSTKSHDKVPFVYNMKNYTHKAKKQMSRKRLSKPKLDLVDIEGNPTEEDKQSWEDKHNFYNSFGSVDPTQYDHESDYLDDLRIKWKEYYDPAEMYDVNPSDYDTEEDYMEAIRMYIKSKYR